MHYDSRHIQVRADFMGLCQYNRDEYKDRRKKEPNQECMAKILRLLETLTDHAKAEWKLKTMKAEEKGLAKPKEPERYPIELSNGAIVHLIYNTFAESTVRNSLNYLIEIGYIGYSQEKKNGIPHIWIEQEYIQSLLKLQAQVILAGYEFRPPSYQGAKSYPDDAISNPSTPISYPDPPILDPPGCESTDDNISNNIDNITYKTEQEKGNAPASVIDFTEEKKKRTDPGMPVVQVTTDTLSHSYSTHDYGNAEDEDDTPTEKVPVVKIGENDGHSDSTSDSRAFHYRDSTARLAAPLVPAVAGHQERVEAHRANDGAGTHRSLSDAARGQTSFYVEPVVADPPVGTRQAAPGLRITHAPTSKSVAQATLPEPKPQTRKQVESQEVRRESEIWARVERKLETTFSRSQRKSPKNKRGMEHMIEDQISDEMIDLGLDRLSEWEINNFNVEMFHELLPGKTAKHRSSQQNGKAPSTASKKSTDVNDYSITALLKRQAARQA